MIAISSTQSPAKPLRLSLKVENPALQKADIAWNNAIKSYPCIPKPLMRHRIIMNPMNSMKKVVRRIFLMIERGLYSTSSIYISLMMPLFTKETVCRGIATNRVANVTIPKPPTWMRSRIIVCPILEN